MDIKGIRLGVPLGVMQAMLRGAQSFYGAQTGGPVALTSSSNSVAIDMSLGNNFTHTLTESTTFANPTNVVAGTSGFIFLTQAAGASYTVAYGSYWVEGINGVTPTVSTTHSATNLYSWVAFDATHIWYSLAKAGVA